MGEVTPLEVRNIVHIGAGQHSDPIMHFCREQLLRVTFLGLDSIIVFCFGVLSKDACHCCPVYAKFGRDDGIRETGLFQMDNPGFFGG